MKRFGYGRRLGGLIVIAMFVGSSAALVGWVISGVTVALCIYAASLLIVGFLFVLGTRRPD